PISASSRYEDQRRLSQLDQPVAGAHLRQLEDRRPRHAVGLVHDRRSAQRRRWQTPPEDAYPSLLPRWQPHMLARGRLLCPPRPEQHGTMPSPLPAVRGQTTQRSQIGAWVANQIRRVTTGDARVEQSELLDWG